MSAGEESPRMRLRPCGPTAWLVDELDDPIAWARGLRQLAVNGVGEVVPAERSVLVRVERDALDAVATACAEVVPVPADPSSAVTVIPTDFSGPDLGDVADATGLDADEVVRRLVDSELTVAFCGFSPGFAYLRGLDPTLHVPRRASPRPSVPAGSVAIAAHYAAVYPTPSPGGWHLLGTTDVAVWDPSRAEPALLVPGTRVRFEDRGVS